MVARWRAMPWVLGLAFACYVLAGTYQLELPGLNYDEALDAVPAMQLVLGQPLDSYATLRLAGREWPLMVMPYVGCVSTYLLVPAFALLGVSVQSLRLANVALGLLTLGLVWGFLREYLDERAANLSTLLLALNPSYVFWTRIGAYVSLPMLPLSILTLWALLRWYRRGKPAYLAAAAFCFGLGLSTKLLFVWLGVSLGLGWLLLSPALFGQRGWRAWLWPLRRASLWVWGASALVFALGSAMPLLYNLQGWGTLRLIARNLRQTELYGVRNVEVLRNLGTVLRDDLRALLDGSWFGSSLGGPHANPLAVPAMIAALLGILYLQRRGRLAYSPKRVALTCVILGSIVVQSAFTITSLGANHLLIAWPMPQALLSVALFSSLNLAEGKIGSKARAVGATLAVALLVGAELATMLRYHHTLTLTGGRSHFSDAIYALAADLDSPGAAKPVAMDWGLRRNLQLLTRGSINAEEGFEYSQSPGPDVVAWLDRRVTESPALYVFHAPRATAFAGYRELLEEVAYRHRLTPVLWKTYRERGGEPVYEVLSLAPTPRLFTVPTMAHVLDVYLGDGLMLLGYDLEPEAVQPGARLRLTLYWQAQKRQTCSLKVFVHLVGEAGRISAQHDAQPMSWGHPTTAWEEGEIVPDRVSLAVPDDARRGDYRLLVGMYDEASGQRSSLYVGGQRVPGDALSLAQVIVR